MPKDTLRTVRAYRDEDRAALFALADRLAVGIAPWRSADGMRAAARGWVAASIEGIGPERAVFVAEGEGGAVVGFASVARQVEFTGEPQAYIGELAVDEAAEGAGIGGALLAAVEAWAHAQGLTLIVLDTGIRNARARRFYDGHGFVAESVRLTKVLNPAGL